MSTFISAQVGVLNSGLIVSDIKVRNYEIRIDQQNTFPDFYQPMAPLKEKT